MNAYVTVNTQSRTLYEVPYEMIHSNVKKIINSRDGMNNAKNAFTTRRIIGELTGLFIEIIEELQPKHDTVQQYFDLTLNHKFDDLPRDGKAHLIHEYVDPALFNNPIYYMMETILMNFKPASVQVGTGEFFFCWYHSGSVFGIDNQLNFDVYLQDMKLELKGVNSNLTASNEKFHNYMKICDGIMVVGAYNNRTDDGTLKTALTRSWFCINTTDWTESFVFQGRSLRLVNQNEQLRDLSKRYKDQELKELADKLNALVEIHGPFTTKRGKVVDHTKWGATKMRREIDKLTGDE